MIGISHDVINDTNPPSESVQPISKDQQGEGLTSPSAR
jgi:hypothetical protein